MRTGKIEIKNDCGVQIYKIIYPDYSTISVKNFKNAINFRPDQREPCKNSWYQDLSSTHIRNKRLLDLPCTYPKCCADIYNIAVDRQKLKKLQKYGLSRPVRTMISQLKVDQAEKFKPEPERTSVEIIPVDCAQIPDNDSEEEDDDDDNDDGESGEDEYDWLAECERRCTKCYTLDEINRRKKKKDWGELLHRSEEELCKGVIHEIMEKYKGRFDAELKLKTRI